MGGGLILNPTSHELQLGSTVYGGPAVGRCQCCRGINGTPPANIYVTFWGIAACSVGEEVGNGPILNGNVYPLTFDPAYCDSERFDYYGLYEYHCRWRYTDSEIDITFQHYVSGFHYEAALGRVVDMQISLEAKTYCDLGGGGLGWRHAFQYHQYALYIPLCFTAPSFISSQGCAPDGYVAWAHGYGGSASWRAFEYEPWVSGRSWAVGDIVVHNGVFYIFVGQGLYNDSEPGVDPDWSLWWDVAPPCPPPKQWVGGRPPRVDHPYYSNPGSVWYPAHVWVSNNGLWYRTGGGHWGLSENEPGVGANWQSCWAVLP